MPEMKPRPLDPAQRRAPEEWCEAYGLTVLDPDGWRVPGAPAWTDPVGLAEFYHRAIESTTDGAFTGAFTRIAVDLDAWAAAAERRSQAGVGDA